MGPTHLWVWWLTGWGCWLIPLGSYRYNNGIRVDNLGLLFIGFIPQNGGNDDEDKLARLKLNIVVKSWLPPHTYTECQIFFFLVEDFIYILIIIFAYF